MPASHSNKQPPILPCIKPAKFCRLEATLLLANRITLDPEHLLHNHLVKLLDARQERLKSRRLFVPTARKPIDNASELNIRVDKLYMDKWNT